MADRFVLQVVCGQQHTLCRAVPRTRAQNQEEEGGLVVGSAVGADVYVWGNGILGQLGIGKFWRSVVCALCVHVVLLLLF
jgi:hypothetical protein